MLVAWLIQGGVGVALLRRRRATPLVLWHVLPIAVALGLWTWFTLGGPPAVGWVVFGVFVVALGVGDAMLVQRAVPLLPPGTTGIRRYPEAIRLVFTRRMPSAVVFHALFSPVVFFGALVACLLGSWG